MNVYTFFKEMFTRLSIALFLSSDIGGENAREISTLMTDHWRGVISIPLPIAIPFAGWRSGYSKALEAKEKLLGVIMDRLRSGSLSQYCCEDGCGLCCDTPPLQGGVHGGRGGGWGVP